MCVPIFRQDGSLDAVCAFVLFNSPESQVVEMSKFFVDLFFLGILFASLKSQLATQLHLYVYMCVRTHIHIYVYLLTRPR